VKNIQVIDGADNATYAICAAEDDQFDIIFPGGADMEFIGDLFDRVGDAVADSVAGSLWHHVVHKESVEGIHGTLIYEQFVKRGYFLSKQSTEIDRVDSVAYRWLRTPSPETLRLVNKYLHVQLVDERPETDYPVFAVTRAEFEEIFPNAADMEFESDLMVRLGPTRGSELLYRIFGRRVPKTTVRGIHGMFFRGSESRKAMFPTKRSTEELLYADSVHS